MISRRRFVSATAGAIAVLGFSPRSRRWIAAAQASSPPFEHLPPLDGEVVTDPSSLAADSTDTGNIVQHTPAAILRPGSVDDIRKMVCYCRGFGIKVAARGQHHSTFGQSLVDGGLTIETATLGTIHSFGPTGADVDAGVLWKELLLHSVPNGLAPPVITGFTGLSIGGTLSVGGISTNSHFGAQVDRVQQLQVVTGAGEVVDCSVDHQRDLFEGVLAGLGQLGIITRARVDMVRVKPMTRTYLLYYVDNGTFFADLRTLLARDEFNDVYNIWGANPAGGFVYQLNAVIQFDPAHPPDDSHLLRGLHFDPASKQVQDAPYLDFLLRVDGAIDFFKSIGMWEGVIHPWFDAFLPDSTVERYLGEVLPTLTPADVGSTGFMLLFPQRRSQLTRPFLRVPECDEWVYLFDILTANSHPGPDAGFTAQMVARNRRLFDKARAMGGTRYPIGVVPFSRADWSSQYGQSFPDLVRLKLRYDPDNILTPGPGIF